MRKMLNTLFVITPGSYLRKDGETVVVRIEGENRIRVPVIAIEGVVCVGPRIGCSPALLSFLAERQVAVSFMSRSGRFLARVQGPVSGNVLLRRAQYRTADDPERSARIGAAVVFGKIANSRNVLLRVSRDHAEKVDRPALQRAVDRMKQLLDGLSRELPLEDVRGLEGEAARCYFGVFDHLITAQKGAFAFRGRSRRPPLDPVNAMLSFAYTMLAHDVSAALQAVGLDPQVGFLHRDRPGRPSLALDLMEELRPIVADRLVVSLINRCQVEEAGFEKSELGEVRMGDATRKAFIGEYQKKKRDEVMHPFLGERVPVGLLPHVQALLLARHLRGDLGGYPPFLGR
jgi:CRISPR-associated protein Cas1